MKMSAAISGGEQIAIALAAMAIQELNAPAISFTGAPVRRV
jgi:aspartokinase